MKIYNIPTKWSVYSIAEINANSLDEAIELAKTGKYDKEKEWLEAEKISETWTIQHDFIEISNMDLEV